MRIAIIDLGTNTFNLLVAEQAAGKLHILHSEEIPVFLGKGGIEQGVIAPDALQRGITALAAHMAKAKELGAEQIRGFGTSMLRNAANGGDFLRMAKSELGLEITLIHGDEEAGLILDGVRQAVAFTAKPMLVMDIGGGSIEFILATDKALMWKRSFELGVTRLRERFHPSDPITLEEHLRIAGHLDSQLEPLWAMMERHWPTTLIGSAGSFDSLARMIAHEHHVDIAPDQTTLAMSSADFDALKDRLLALSRNDRLRVPGLPEHRVDTIALGLIAIERVMLRGIGEIRWSRYALKEGAAVRLFDPAATLPK